MESKGACVDVGPAEPAIVGRSSDQKRLAAVVDRLRAGLSAALVVSGEAGIGKTLLIHHTLRNAADLQTISVSGYEAEVRFGFAALHRLVLPLLGSLPGLPALQRDALSTAFGLHSGPAPNRFLVGLATLALLEQAARHRPLLCVVDDVQWVDEETMDTLAFVARRLDAEAVGLVFGLRSSGPASIRLRGIPEHRVAPMPDGDMRSLLLHVAHTPPTSHVAARLITESEGNPLALLEYVGSLSPDRLAGNSALPAALPVSERLSAGFAEQIARLPSGTRQMLLVLSAAGFDDADAASEACRRLGISPDAALPALRAAILTARPRLVFRHPLIRSVVYNSAGPAARHRVHALLAEVADQQGSADAAAWHYARATTGSDENAAARLEQTAARARARGGYAAEAHFLTMSAERTVAGTEAHSRRVLAAAEAHIIAGGGVQADRLLEGSSPGGILGARVVAARVAAAALASDSRTGLEASMLVRAARELPPEEIILARKLHCEALYLALQTRGYTLDTTLRNLAQGLLDQPPPHHSTHTAADLLFEALATRCASGYVGAAPIVHDALHCLSKPLLAMSGSTALLTWLAMEDVWADEFASTTWAELTRLNQAHGAWPAAWVGLGSSGLTAARHGNFEVAQAFFDEATSVGVAMGINNGELLWAVLAEFRAWQGREAETRAMADRMIHFMGEDRRFGSSHSFAHLALTVLDLSQCNYTAALAHATGVALDDPPGHGSRILPDLIEAASRTGDDVVAERALADLTIRAIAAGTPWALGVLARSRAVAQRGSADAGPHYEEALSVLSATPLRTEIARTQLLFGEWLRRRKRRSDAREQLGAAASAFTDMGATLFTQRAERELAAAGGRSVVLVAAQRSLLTPQEARVAALAADGMTNREISEQLFISDSTVGYHVSKVLRKLQITSRRRIRETLEP